MVLAAQGVQVLLVVWVVLVVQGLSIQQARQLWVDWVVRVVLEALQVQPVAQVAQVVPPHLPAELERPQRPVAGVALAVWLAMRVQAALVAAVVQLPQQVLALRPRPVVWVELAVQAMERVQVQPMAATVDRHWSTEMPWAAQQAAKAALVEQPVVVQQAMVGRVVSLLQLVGDLQSMEHPAQVEQQVVVPVVPEADLNRPGF